MIALFLTGFTAGAGDWPQLQCDPQRSGYTPERIAPPFKTAWHRNFHPERVARQLQPVVYRGAVYVGTLYGNLYALDAATGQERWKQACGAPIPHTAACAHGKVVVALLDGTVRAFRADDGQPVWQFRGVPYLGFSTAPLIADGTVFIGQRGGMFYALSLADGTLRWSHDAGAPIFNTAAWDAGRVYFCAEDLRLRCLDAATGRLVWVTEQMYGQSAKDYHPVVLQGLVMLRPMRTSPPVLYWIRPEGGETDPKRFFRCTYLGAERWRAFFDWWYGRRGPSFPEELRAQPGEEDRFGYLAYMQLLADHLDGQEVVAGRIPRALVEAQEALVAHLTETPTDQDLFVFDAQTGQPAFVPPHFPSVHSHSGPVCPPAWDGKEGIVIPWTFGSHGWARLSLRTRRLLEIIPTPRGGNSDETLNVSVGGDLLFILHCQESNANYTGIYDLTRRIFYELPRFSFPAGSPGRGFCASELHDNCESGGHAAAIGAGHFYHIVFHQLAAWTSAGEGTP